MKIKRTLLAAAFACLSVTSVNVFGQAPAELADATKLGQQFEQCIQTKQHDPAVALIDAHSLLATSEAGINAPAKLAKEFADGASSTLPDSMVNSLIGQISAGSSYKFCRAVRRDGKVVAQFRLEMAAGAVNYFELSVLDDSHGQPHIVDVYDLAKGEWVTQTLRRFYLAMVISDDKTFAAALSDRERELADGGPALQEMSQASADGKWQKELDLYKQLSPTMKQEKTTLYMRVVAADQLAETAPDEYTAAVADFQKYFPNDPALDLLQLDKLIIKKQYAAAHEAVDRLIAFIGDDSHLDYLQGNIYFLSADNGSYLKAIAEYQKAISLEPDAAESYWGLVTVYLRQKDNADTAATLTQIQQKLHLEISDLTKIPLYADFAKSKEYAQWLSAQPKAAASTQPG